MEYKMGVSSHQLNMRSGIPMNSPDGSTKSLTVTSPIHSKIDFSPDKLISSEISFAPQRIISPSRSSTQNSRARRSMNSSSISDSVCRICHGGGSSEQLFSPCYCSGTVGLIHLSCLQRWLGSSNKTSCELCKFQFRVERHPKPFRLFLKNPGRRRDKRHLICDIICFSFLAPSTIATAYLCIVGSRMYDSDRIEAILLYCLTLALMILLSAWLTMCLRHNYGLWTEWKQFNQNVRIICEPLPQQDKQNTSPDSKLKRVKLCSIKIKVSTNMGTENIRTVPEIYQHINLTDRSGRNKMAVLDHENQGKFPNKNQGREIVCPSQSLQSNSSSSREDGHARYTTRSSYHDQSRGQDDAHRSQTNAFIQQRPISEQNFHPQFRAYSMNTYV